MMKQLCTVVLGCWLVQHAAMATEMTWKGGSGEWSDDANWTNGVPGLGDVAIVNSGSVLLTNETVELASFTMNGGTLTFTNWNTRLSAETVEIPGGTVTLPPAFTNNVMSNRVWFACTDFTLGTNGEIDVAGKGYQGGSVYTERQGQGPGGGPSATTASIRQGASYGGQGNRIADSVDASDALTYGSAEAPLQPGSGGGSYNWNDTAVGGNGGGAVLIEASGHIALNGSILANGMLVDTAASGGGSGGGVFLTCQTLSGAGTVTANGSSTLSPSNSGNGGGGRIAVHYTPEAQAELPVPAITFLAKAGSAGIYPAEMGTLYFPNTHLLMSTITNLSGYLYCGEITTWAPDSLTVDNAMSLTLSTNFTVTITNDLMVTGNAILTVGHAFDHGAMGGLTVGGDVTLDDGQLHYYFAEDFPESLTLGGGLELTNGAALYLYAGPTNLASVTAYGGMLDLSGKHLVIPTNCVIYPSSHPTNCASIKIQVGDLTVQAGGAINADGLGGAGGEGETAAEKTGYGPGGGSAGTGGGYGGQGGYNGGAAYGSETGPMLAGSGGGGYLWGVNFGGAGGGLIDVDATGDIIMDGVITARGTIGEDAGGSGGGVLLLSRTFSGSGTIRADGGDVTIASRGAGGGGRVAIWTGLRVTVETPPASIIVSEDLPATFSGPYPTVAAGDGSTATPPAEDGTVRFVNVPFPCGTVIAIQ